MSVIGAFQPVELCYGRLANGHRDATVLSRANGYSISQHNVRWVPGTDENSTSALLCLSGFHPRDGSCPPSPTQLVTTTIFPDITKHPPGSKVTLG